MYFVKKNNKENSFLDDFTNFFSDGFISKDLKTDIVDKENQYEVTMDVPGINKNDISISFEDKTLTINVNRVNEENKEKKNYICKERSTSSYSRSFYLEDGDETNVKAKLDSGVLMVCVGKMAPVNNKKTIEIE